MKKDSDSIFISYTQTHSPRNALHPPSIAVNSSVGGVQAS